MKNTSLRSHPLKSGELPPSLPSEAAAVPCNQPAIRVDALAEGLAAHSFNFICFLVLRCVRVSCSVRPSVGYMQLPGSCMQSAVVPSCRVTSCIVFQMHQMYSLHIQVARVSSIVRACRFKSASIQVAVATTLAAVLQYCQTLVSLSFKTFMLLAWAAWRVHSSVRLL